MNATNAPDGPAGEPLSLDRRTGWVLLALALSGGSWLV
jgi:hypothetical protein